MRLLLLPISTRRALVYCEPPSHAVPAAQQTYLDKAVNYASNTWAGWEKSDTSWKLKVTQYGNNFLRRIPFEEWSLKSIPSRRKLAAGEKEQQVDVVYPSLYQGLQKESVMNVLRRLSTERQSLHKNRLFGSIALMPITAPVAIIPIMPNFPFLYLAFRAYSHFRAWKGSQHLEYLVGKELIKEKPTGMLDSLYTAGLLHETREALRMASEPTERESRRVVEVIRRQAGGGSAIQEKEGEDVDPVLVKGPVSSAKENVAEPPPQGALPPSGGVETQEEEIMLLRGWNGRILAERLKLPGLEIEIERAVEQVEKTLSGRKEAAAGEKKV